ncbi:hypothetical protein R1CP_23540 [Rhodococcus opacus]|uniref:HNH nuclease domain-containing protein n=1 Tax=Rhodococcus opacus TaxID=37919 RepID=A0A1B1K9X6_RHOOP|nr:HNH endonuclease signature motif containing protein [Rhodococcus opacus]ANS29376.1 hypothetical protein R1CP_23540 [Rhodococcus opacus]
MSLSTTRADAPWAGNGAQIPIYPILDALSDAQFLATVRRLNDKGLADPDGHILWTGALSDEGYPKFTLAGVSTVAHRVAWVLANGRDPLPGYTIDHECRTRNCINPEHLRELTMRDNALAGRSPAALNAAKLFCDRLHPLLDGHPNTYIRPDGARGCRECRVAAQRKSRARRLVAHHVAAHDAAVARGEKPDAVVVHVGSRKPKTLPPLPAHLPPFDAVEVA